MTRELVLGIETSGRVGTVAAWSPQDADPGRTFEFGEGLIHGVAVAPAVRQALDWARVSASDLSLVAVGTGPGSYTGVRIGVAFAKSLAFATGVPAIGVCTFEAGAGFSLRPGEEGHVVYARDARRGAVYLAVYRVAGGKAEEVVPPRLASLDELAELLPEGALVVGDAFERYRDVLSGMGRVPAEEAREPDALDVARFGMTEFRRRGPDPTHDLAPLYFRVSEAEERFGVSGEPA